MRKEEFAPGEFYHIYNRGVDKREIFLRPFDSERFLKTIIEFNTVKPTGGLYENTFRKEGERPKEPLVNIIAYCLNPNHFHLLLEEVFENGISKLMHRITGGYTWYFNKKYNRSGSLFQGPFKAKHIKDNDYLLRVSAYINANDRIHQLSGLAAKLVRSSWWEYDEPKNNASSCKKNLILEQFNTPAEYRDFVEKLIPEMIEVKTLEREQELADLWHES